MSMNMEEMSFEEAMKKLEECVGALGAGKLSLDEMVRLYEEGNALSEHCVKLLDAYEARIGTVEEV